jgi:hypothetical protein
MPLFLRKSTTQAKMEGLSPDIWREHDFSVVDGEACVGRIYREQRDGEWRWWWLLHAQPPAPSEGMAETLEEAATALKQRYDESRRRT